MVSIKTDQQIKTVSQFTLSPVRGFKELNFKSIDEQLFDIDAAPFSKYLISNELPEAMIFAKKVCF